MKSYTLGLDIGSNSIGWALLGDGKKPSVVDIGVRVFPKGVGSEKENEKTKCAVRREARGTRRVHQRRNLRRDELVKTLRAAGLLPEKEQELNKLFKRNPYELRAKGLEEKLDLYEFGRALFHINQRRGFKSNRKIGEANEKSKIAKGDKDHKGANELRKTIKENNYRTIGKYFAGVNPEEWRIRGQYTFRSMYEEEFDKLWEKQSEYYPQILTEDLCKRIRDKIIFYQRPMKWDPDTVGDCELEKDENGLPLKRCPKGDWYARRFRILQDVNNLKIRNPDSSELPLTEEQRGIVLIELGKKKKVKFEDLKKQLSKKGFGLLEKQRFNFEEDGDNNYMNGDWFSEQMRSKKLLGPKEWDKLDENVKIAMNQTLLELDDDEEVKEQAVKEFGFSEGQAKAFSEVRLEEGYRRYSKEAILKLLPYMEKGLRTDEAKKEAGYKERIVEIGEPLGKLTNPNDLRNPIVMSALHEVRRLVNKIKEEYGKPKKIVVEMARELKNTKKARQKALKQNRENRKLNEDAEKWVAENTSIKNPKYDDILKYKLWIECDKTCPYTGKSICKTDLFEEPVFQIEHILPHERTSDDSYMNKTLCYVDENAHVKGGRTPFEAYSDKPEKYEDIKQRISCLPPPKRERFLQDKIPEGHIERELNDTRYITRETIKYLRKLGVIVKGTRGAATNALRHSWGLDGIFTELGVGRDEDHRKHAVDAVIVAVTTSKQLHTLSKTKYSKVKKTFPPPENWPHFREELAEKVKHIDVSHRVTKRVSGKLHEETFYGLTKEAKAYFKKGNFKKVEMRQLSKNAWLCRKKFSYIYSRPPQEILKKVNDLDGITNDAKNVKDAIRKRLMENGISIENKKAKIPKDLFKEPLYLQSNKGKKIPVKKIRVCKPFSNMIIFTDKEGNPYRAVATGNNHHIEIFEYKDKKGQTKRDGKVITMFKAVQRSQRGESIVCRDYKNGKNFVCSLAQNELFMIELNDDSTELHRVQKITQSGNNITITLRPHTYAGKVSDSDKPPLVQRRSPNTLKGHKVTVDMLGRVHLAND